MLRPRIRSGYTKSPLVDRIVLSPPAGEVASLVVNIANQANKYTLNTYIPAAHPGTDEITDVGGFVEENIRPPASAAFGLAATLATGTHSEATTGHTYAQSRAACARLVNGLSRTHRSSGGAWGGVTGVAPGMDGFGWQSALWAGQIGFAAWLIWDELTVPTKNHVLAMLIHEANRMVPWTLPYWKNRGGVEQSSGDSKSEEVAWDTLPLILLLAMTPYHPSAAAWTAKLCLMGLAAHSVPADISSTTLSHGAQIGTLLNGTNVNPDGTIVNHGILHPDYIVASAGSMWGTMAALTASGKPIPKALKHNASLVYSSLSALNFSAPPYAAPGGTIYTPGSYAIYYPSGTDWGAFRMMDKATMDVMAMVYGWDAGIPTSASGWAILHLTQQAYLQSRGTTGQTYQAAQEDTYSGREQWVSMHAAACLVTLSAGAGRETNATPAEIVEACRA